MTLSITHNKVATLPDQPGVEVNKAEWNDTHALSGTLTETQGGTNQTTYTKGDVLVASAANTLAKLPVGTDGFHLLSNSNATNGVGYYQSGFAVPGFVSGRYYGPWVSGSFSTRTLSANKASVIPMYISQPATFTGLAFWATANASAGSCKLGVYANSNGQPGALVAGTSVTSTTPATGVTIDAAFSSPKLLDVGWYWLAILTDQAITFTAVGASSQNCTITGLGLLSTTSGGVEISAVRTYASGLADPFGAVTYGEATTSVYVALKAQ